MSKAWFAGFAGDETGVTFAETRAKAKYTAYCAALEAGWNARLIDMNAKRAPEFDAWEDGPLWELVTVDFARSQMARQLEPADD